MSPYRQSEGAFDGLPNSQCTWAGCETRRPYATAPWQCDRHDFEQLRAVLDAISVMVVMQMYADAEHERRLDALNLRLLPGESAS